MDTFSIFHFNDPTAKFKVSVRCRFVNYALTSSVAIST